ncbi:hypothetical protein CAPTEDRAFT_191510 [Capitella teleta]|uniref:Uncharacterized protein n=1 Tax=Capitella teleta TaxID=283909 RepID=R7U918_CAPTE|nr:hypothetical protein CAPTEDRAFT_191510 [Capitella teleta]|eukprot:ELU00192.1 hypothetical protein CAPTEDRAFT_191510 [Capitella teleta]
MILAAIVAFIVWKFCCVKNTLAPCGSSRTKPGVRIVEDYDKRTSKPRVVSPNTAYSSHARGSWAEWSVRPTSNVHAYYNSTELREPEDVLGGDWVWILDPLTKGPVMYQSKSTKAPDDIACEEILPEGNDKVVRFSNTITEVDS